MAKRRNEGLRIIRPADNAFEDENARKARLEREKRAREEADRKLRENLSGLDAELKKKIFGQDKAIDALVSAVQISMAGLRKKNRPVGSFLFLGPTGTGKTEVSIQLAELMDYKFLRIDMSEFKHNHQVARLIGPPPGYVGFDSTKGQLTDFVSKNPRCVVLLDEIEKAHTDIYDILLQIMDHAKLTDGANRTVDFSNVVLIMTSNIGAADKNKGPSGLNSGADKPAQNDNLHHDAAISRAFSPEFRNRLDEIIEFSPLSPAIIAMIVDKFIVELQEQLKEKSIALTLSPAARNYIAHNGFDRKMGARPLDRFITKELRKKIAPEMLFGKLAQGGTVHVDTQKDGGGKKETLRFTFNSAAKPEPKSPAAHPQTPAPKPPQP